MSVIRLSPAAIFAPLVPPDRLSSDLRLLACEWGVYFSLTGKHTISQLQRHLQMPSVELERSLFRLMDLGLVGETELTLGQYLRAAATVEGNEPIALAAFLKAGAAGLPDEESLLALDEPLQTALSTGSVRWQEQQEHARTAILDALPFEPLESFEKEPDLPNLNPFPTALPTRRLSLRAVMDVLMRQANGPDAGQLDVYRTFLRVDPALLRRNGIVTLHFEDDRVVADPELIAAIVESAQRTLGGVPPSDIFVQN